MNLAKLKSLFLKSLIGCLVASAAIAVITILIGHFSDICGKALLTILVVAIHSLISFSFVVNNERQETFESLSAFTNATFGIIILSFITSLLGVWHVLPPELVWKMYGVYFIVLFAVLHMEVLARTLGKQQNIDAIVKINYGFIVVVVAMIMPLIFMSDSSSLGGFYFRLLAACGVVDATLTLIAIITHKLYLQKHPKLADPVFMMPLVPGQPPVAMQQASQPKQRRGMNIFVILLLAYVVIQFTAAIVIGFLGKLHS